MRATRRTVCWFRGGGGCVCSRLRYGPARLTATVEAAALAALLPHPPALRHLRMRVKVDAPPVLWLVPHQHRSERDLTASAATAAVTTAAIDVVVAGRRPTAAAAALRRPIVSGAPATTATVAVAVAIVLLLVHVVGFVEALEIREARLRRRALLQAGGKEGWGIRTEQRVQGRAGGGGGGGAEARGTISAKEPVSQSVMACGVVLTSASSCCWSLLEPCLLSGGLLEPRRAAVL